ncbi:MAG: glycosyltransferase [Adhaeribacter sp.]
MKDLLTFFFQAYFIMYFGVYLAVLLLLALYRRKAPAAGSGTPAVSILVAVRNEAHQIGRCLESLSRLHYPAGQVEILLGDDDSTDNSAALIQDFIRDKPQFRYLLIRDQLGSARGKANVLAHLAREASSDFFLITDADIALPPNWIRQMLAGREAQTGIVTGITTIAGIGLFARLQALDWINALGLMQVLSDMNLPVSTMGNNMLVTREAYEATGGYENMPFSLTEDTQLLQAVLRQGYGSRNIFAPGVLAASTPAPSWRALWQQRRRWMVGLRYLPVYMKLVSGVYASFYAVVFGLAFLASWQTLAGVLTAKLLLQTVFLKLCLRRINLRFPLWVLLLFEFYLIFVSAVTLFMMLLPGKITWKERKY